MKERGSCKENKRKRRIYGERKREEDVRRMKGRGRCKENERERKR